MVHAVTVGIDGSPESLVAARWAADAAVRRAVPLRLLRVWDPDDPRTRPAPPETARRWGERMLTTTGRRIRRHHPALPVDTAWVRGQPVEALCGAAAAGDLLVLGSRGLSGPRGFLTGSVSLAVLAHTRCPAVLVRPRATVAGGDRGPSGDIVVGVDLSGPCDDTLRFAFRAAAEYGCGVRVVHSWAAPAGYGPDPDGAPDPEPAAPREAEESEHLQEAEEPEEPEDGKGPAGHEEPTDPRQFEDHAGHAGHAEFAEFAEFAERRRDALDRVLRGWTERFPGIPVTVRCRPGRPAWDLAEASRGARLVVVGRRNRQARLGPQLGAVTHGLIHHSRSPVAVVPHD
ncbi:universal stress protein [Streptomyces pactum]|uniref:universal stress protein n=1 Tax=Streptomyces pactum TaxID=68249 RepID=UPI0036FF011A